MAVSKNTKPKKPYPEFPLFAHASKQWAKKIRGRMWYFGVWDEPDSALKKFTDEIHEIQAGRDPRRLKAAHVSSEDLTVYDMCNLFLERQQGRVKAGDVSNRHFGDCFKSCKLVTDHFGTFQSVGSLRVADFQSFRATFPVTWGPTKITNEIKRIRAAFKWAFDSEMIPALPNFGPDFKPPSKTVGRRDQQQRQAVRGGKLDFSSKEIKKLLKVSTGWLRACILLGINGGMGNADCGRLSTTFLDLKSGWYDLPRHKTGIPRRFRLWPETIAAIRTAMSERPIAKDEANDKLCFLTSHGKPVWWEATSLNGVAGFRDSVTRAFTALCADCGIARSQRGFYSLRRTFETVAGNSKDQVAVDVVMGHSDQSMAAVYRQGIDDQRLIDVGNHVHAWLFPKEKKKPAKRAAKKASGK
jgi:integrase